MTLYPAPGLAPIGTRQRPLFGAVSLSLLLHGVFVGVAILAWTHRPPDSAAVDRLLGADKLIWIGREGPGGNAAASPSKLRQPLRRMAHAHQESRRAAAHVAPADPHRDPILAIAIPSLPEASGLQKLPGTGTALMITEGGSADSGADNQAGSGLNGVGGRGVNGGERDGAGDSGPGSGSGTTLPWLVQQVRPAYTTAALQARAQGIVAVEAVVNPDGSVGDVRVLRSFDPSFGLDAEAVRAVKQWRFRPGSRQGRAVPMIVTIELTFSLR
jgi:TonB family protein